MKEGEKGKLERIKDALAKNGRKEGEFANADYTLGAIQAIIDMPEREVVKGRRRRG